MLHSTHAFAEHALNVHGAISTVARIGGAACDTEREAGVLCKLLAAAATRLAPRWIAREHIDRGVVLGRISIGGATLSPAARYSRRTTPRSSAHVVFLGDYIDSPRAGSVEVRIVTELWRTDLLSYVASQFMYLVDK